MPNLKNIKQLIVTLAVFGVVTFGSSLTAKADLVQLTNVQLEGQGIGAVLTVLTLQTTGTATTESGGVAFAGGLNPGFQAFGDFSPPDGPPKNQPFTYAQLGAANASEIVLIVNLAEPNNEVPATVTATDGAGTLADRLTLNVWTPSGTLLSSHTLAADTVLVMDQSGVGGSGLVFALNGAQAAIVNAHGQNVVFTVGATFASAQGGNDTIQAARLVQLEPIPEPASMLLLGTGLLGLAGAARKRFKIGK